MASGSLRQYAIVGFLSETEAQSAMQAALREFKSHLSNFNNLSYCKGNIVYLQAQSPEEKKYIENFLLMQKGAQPRGCRCEIN